MANINFDEFEREIKQAESYLNSASTKGQKDNNALIAAEDKPSEHHETLFFASDSHGERYDEYDERLSLRATTMHVPNTNLFYTDPLMETLRFTSSDRNDSTDTGDIDRSGYLDQNEGTLFYASDVISDSRREYREPEQEETLSFLPSPNNQQYMQRQSSDAPQFSESLTETIRFTKPIEPALRSLDGVYFNSTEHNLTNSNTPPPSLGQNKASSTDNSNTSNKNNNNNNRAHSAPRYGSAHRRRDPENDFFSETSAAPVTTRRSLPRPPSPAKFVRPVYVPETFGPRRSANAISMERIDELQRKRVLAKQELLKKKRALEELQMRECTFTPQISKGTRVILHQKEQFEQLDADCRHANVNVNVNVADENAGDANHQSSKAAMDASERLYKEASIRAAQHKWINVQVGHLRDAQYTFQPVVNPHTPRGAGSSSSGNNGSSGGGGAVFALDRRPIHERMADMMKEKKQYLLALKTSLEEQQTDLTFHPRIDERSRSLAEQKIMGYGGNTNLPRGRASVSASRGGGSSSNSPQRALSGEQQTALVLGFHADVGSRLNDQGRLMAKRKQQLLHERDNQLAEAMQQATICKQSAKIVQNTGLKETFEARQAQYRQRERERHEAQLREREHITNNWFRPHIDPKSSAIVHEQRPEQSLESVEQKSRRLSVQDAQEMLARKEARAAALYGAIPFTPAIDPLSRHLGRSSSIDDLVQNRRALEARARVRQRVEEEENQECTFKPQINDLSKQLLQPSEDDIFLQKYNSDYAQVGWAQQGCNLNDIEPGIRDSFQRAQNGRINLQEPEKMQRDIRMHALAKEEKRRSELIAREIQELRECTFHPAIDSSLASLDRQRRDTSPVVIRGLGRFLELKHLTARQKEEALQREREVFSVPNVDKYRRAEDGSTVVQSFHFNLTEPRQHSRLDISSAEISPGSLNASTIISNTSHRHITSPAAAAAWCM